MNELILYIKAYIKNGFSAGRLYHGRGKFIKDLDFFNIDFYPPYIHLIFYREPSEELLNELVCLLRQECQDLLDGIYYQKRFIEKSPISLIWGQGPMEFVCAIEGDNYALKFGQTQNIGFFPDFQKGRDFLRLNSKDKHVLNLFSYTCALSVVALKSGAQKVINFDMSKAALQRGLVNHKLNAIPLNKVKFFDHDIFKSFGRIRREGPYDLIIIDPPTDHKEHFKVDRDYAKLIRHVDEWLKSDGILMTCLNSPHHSYNYLIELVNNNGVNLEMQTSFGFPDYYKEQDPDCGLKIIIWKKNG